MSAKRKKQRMPKSKPYHIGQLLCGGFEGTGVNDQAYHLIVDHHVSTFILSKKNAVSVKQMTKLIRDLQFIAYSEAKYKYPLLFAIDQEGGMLNSLFDSEFLTQFPSAMALGAAGDTDLVYEVLKALATELSQIGFRIIFGPVLDVVTKLSHQLVGVRSFGTTVEEVTKNGKASAKGFKDGGMFSFGKHFPGIGNASVDSLLELPMLADSLSQVKNFNVLPFAELIKDSLLDGMSAAGCGVPTISPDEVHACLSPIVVNQLLRQDLGFDGVVISECLEMDALHHSIGLGQGVLLSLYAGVDLILVCHDQKLQDEAVDSMLKALNNGNLDEEIILKALSRIEVLQKNAPSWNQIFPDGDQSAKSEILFFKDLQPEKWAEHKKISQLAYRKSITLVRDYPDALPISKFLGGKKMRKSKTTETNNILLLTPLLLPIYRQYNNKESKLYTGEEVFQEFGNMLSNHMLNKQLATPYKVLHTTYTANGLTNLHETLIEDAKVVIVLTSEASRNIYQIGIVKYVSMLCGASPVSFNNSSSTQSAKPLILVATSSPYDFFYNKSIGSAYLCCYDYTDNALKELVGIIMGDSQAEGCIPGEKKYISRFKKRKGENGSVDSPRSKKTAKRRWLVEQFQLSRDWESLVQLIKNHSDESDNYLISLVSDDTSFDKNASVNYQLEVFYDKLKILLSNNNQKHFVVRNSSLNILYGVILTWCNEVGNYGTNIVDENDTNYEKIGSIVYLLVDRSKRLQSIGRNLHRTAIRYLINSQKCSSVFLGSSFPLVVLPNNSNLVGKNVQNNAISFLNNFNWNVNNKLRKKLIMRLNNLNTWEVPKKIFRELMIVGVRFDICQDPGKLMDLIYETNSKDEEEGHKSDDERSESEELAPEMPVQDKRQIEILYLEAIKGIKSGVKIIIALEPTNQKIIGSIILFTNDSKLAQFYPFIDEGIEVESFNSPESLDHEGRIGCIIGPVIDKSYSNLTEIFKYGLICSAITLIKNNMNEDNMINQVLMIGVNDDKTGNIGGIKEIGFNEWKFYYDYYDRKSSLDTFE